MCPYRTHHTKYIIRLRIKMQCVLMLRQVVHMFTTGLITLNYIIIKPSIILNFLLSLLIFLATCFGWNLP
jgi:hypothetical protein